MESSQTSDRQSPFTTMFEQFRSELDEHHDRRERIIKASRDITAASKKIIFALQRYLNATNAAAPIILIESERVRTLNASIPPGILKSISPHGTAISKLLRSVNEDLQSINFYRYYRQISPGIQEYVESLLFQHYLTAQTLLNYEDAAQNLQAMATPEILEGSNDEQQDQLQPISDGPRFTNLLTMEDYLLGIFDFTGELMRLAITTMATSSAFPNVSSSVANELPKRTTLTDLQTLRAHLAVLNYDYRSDGHFAKDADKKLEVTLASVEKVEKALYGMVIRGSERPKGWVPDLGEMVGRGTREEVESY